MTGPETYALTLLSIVLAMSMPPPAAAAAPTATDAVTAVTSAIVACVTSAMTDTWPPAATTPICVQRVASA